MMLIAAEPPVWWQVTADVLLIVGSLLVVITAIYGAILQGWLAGPIVSIEKHNFDGHKANNPFGQAMVFYYLKVKNSRHSVPARGVRVVLKKFERRGPDGKFYEMAVTIPH